MLSKHSLKKLKKTKFVLRTKKSKKVTNIDSNKKIVINKTIWYSPNKRKTKTIIKSLLIPTLNIIKNVYNKFKILFC